MEERVVGVSEKTYEALIRESERYKMIKSAFFDCVRKTSYGVTIDNSSYLLGVLASACPEEYKAWYSSASGADTNDYS